MLLGMTAIDLTGTWTGHYQQNGGRHGITMQIVQRGQSFVGRMRDDDTILSGRETLHAQPSKGKPGQGDVLAEAEVLSTLPEHSTVEGEVEGRIVTFTKCYQGKSTTSVWVPDKAAMTFEIPGHRVAYLGTLDLAGNEIHGHWKIAGASPEERALRDRFELRRAVDATRPPARS
jgi:hypothetical protein